MPTRIRRNGIDFGYTKSMGIGNYDATASTINANSPFPYRNKIVNGEFLIDQRNAGNVSYYNTANTVQYTADRWALLCSQSRKISAQVVNDGPLSEDQRPYEQTSTSTGYWDNSANVYCWSPKNFTKCIELKSESNYSPAAAGDYYYFMQKIEGNFIRDAKFGRTQGNPAKRYLLFSCWLKTNIAYPANIDVFISNDFTNQTSASARRFYRWTISAYEPVLPARGWVRVWKYIPIDGDQGSTLWYDDYRTGLQLVFVLGAGSNYRSAASTYPNDAWHTTPSGGLVQLSNNLTSPSIDMATNVNNYLRITGVSLEYVDIVDTFDDTFPASYERRDYGLELALCHRYYQKSYSTNTRPGTSGAEGYIYFRDHAYSVEHRYLPWRYNNGPLRSTPIIRYYGYSGTINAGYNGTVGDVTGVVSNSGHNNEHSAMFYFSSANGNSSTPVLGSYLDTLFHWTADAELY